MDINACERYILWTGGFDSTFMLLKYAREKYILHPIYVVDPERKSTKYEMHAMQTILDMLNNQYAEDVKARIYPIKIHHFNDIIDNPNITKSFEKLSSRIKLGSQYEWLSRLASMYPFLDIGVEKHFDGYGGCTTAIMNDGGFVSENGIGRLNIEKSSEETINVFEKFRFPIMNYTGLDMIKIVQSWGWEKIMEQAWFCHNPIINEPCGMCRPCQQKMEDRLMMLLPVAAQKRYKLYSATKKLAGERVADKFTEIYRHMFISNH